MEKYHENVEWQVEQDFLAIFLNVSGPTALNMDFAQNLGPPAQESAGGFHQPNGV